MTEPPVGQGRTNAGHLSMGASSVLGARLDALREMVDEARLRMLTPDEEHAVTQLVTTLRSLLDMSDEGRTR
jgi:hypothetical protein